MPAGRNIRPAALFVRKSERMIAKYETVMCIAARIVCLVLFAARIRDDFRFGPKWGSTAL
jgi:hypothetical protein